MNTTIQILLIIVGTLISAGITYLIKGQNDIRNEAREGRKVLHEKTESLFVKVEKFIERITILETKCKMNHKSKRR